MLSNPEVLQPPNYNFEFELFIDTSDVALGMVLKQCVNGVYRTIAFDGVKNNNTVAKYSTQDVVIKHIRGSKNVEADYISRNISYINTGNMDLITYVHEEITGHGSLPNRSEQFLDVVCIDDIHIDGQIILFMIDVWSHQ
eukprot:TRINITY_DN8341_c0_g1_i11.p1 TRINITY_DN8341_c0_g1~~TRINITY_DN8341_c0_g1_i11.p1  ORF type:complete len:140 (+),score=8.90 TRINITY_DN8341_c0_g1_i11:192-611(+)